MEAKRISEAEGCIKEAEKALKTSMINLKFKPDFDTAASCMERAAVCFRNASAKDRCRDAYIKASEYHESNGVMFHAAKCKEQAAMLSKELGDLDRAKELMLEASQWYAETGTPETSASALEKAGRFFEGTDPDKAVDIYKKAYELVSGTDQIRQAAEFLGRISRLLLKLERYEDAANNIGQEVELFADEPDCGAKVGKLTAGAVLVRLKLGDVQNARRHYHRASKVERFEVTEDALVLAGLINSYEDGDEKMFQDYLNRPHMKGLENEFLRLAKNLSIPESMRREPEKPLGHQKAPGGDSIVVSNDNQEEAEDEEIDLC